MRRAAGVLAVMALTGCAGLSSGGSNGPTAATSHDPADRLAYLDGSANPGNYRAALNRLAPKCTEGRVTVAGYVDAAYRDLARNHVTDETRLSVTRDLARSIPASAAPTNCNSIAAAYLVLRER